MTSIPDQRLYTLQLSRRDLGAVIRSVEYLRGRLPPLQEATTHLMFLGAWLAQVYESAPDKPAYFWLGEEGESIVL